MSDWLLEVENLKVHFPVREGRGLWRPKKRLRAVDGVSFQLAAGDTLGVVGESGCGKSTLARGILGLVPITDGEVMWLGKPVAGLAESAFRPLRRDLQVIFQDPLASLDPRMTIGSIIAEPLKVFRPEMNLAQRQTRVAEIMGHVGLDASVINRYPHEFSGGQCQRVGIARALVLEPKLVVCDEPVSALDVSIQAQIVNLLNELKKKFQLSLIFISHDLSIVRLVSQRLLVLYLGHVMELSDRDAIYEQPLHPYTRSLIRAIPRPDPRFALKRPDASVGRDLPSPINPPSGCVFHTRCPHVTVQCREEVPPLEPTPEGQQVACHHWRSLPRWDPETVDERQEE
jgi:oligopeptide transport system ATP-binding protein